MRKELDQKLCQNYPEIFGSRYFVQDKSNQAFGIECGDGWYPIIDFLCASIMARVHGLRNVVKLQKKNLSDPERSNWPAWKKSNFNDESLEQAKKNLVDAEAAIPRATQVKEKFGGLRFYADTSSDEFQNMITMVESLSYRVCEECGTMQGVVTYTMGWHSTLCPEHADAKYGSEATEFRNKTGQWIEIKNDH